MTLADVLGLLRRMIDETDLTVSNTTDQELILDLKDAAETLSLRMISGMSSYSFVSDVLSASYGITPAPTTEHAHMLCRLAALNILRDQFRGKLNRGELGINWKSGQEEESTISAAKEWQTVLEDMENELELLITFNKSGSHGLRVQ